ncbi:MAG: hypothetical protein PVSMB10_17560 [Pseudarthrobacter sp.]
MENGTTGVVVIGAGQAGLSAAYHLKRRGVGYVILDAEQGPGGAWRHRWKSLIMETVNGISDLPGIAKPDVDPAEPSSEFLSRYFDAYERELGIEVLRPVKVTAVAREDTDPAGRLRISSDRGDWSANAVINATGTWTRPFWPIYPGRSTFLGRQLHVADYVSAEEFRGKHVIVAMDGTQVAAEPRVHLVGYGPSSSTIGANRAGRAAVAAILKLPAFQQ